MKTHIRYKLLAFGWIIGLANAITANAASLNLSWNDNSDNETGFSIERSVDGSPFLEIGTTEPNIAEFTDDSVPVEASVSYRVRAFNEFGFSGYSNTASKSTATPSPPDGLDFKAIAIAVAALLFLILGVRVNPIS